MLVAAVKFSVIMGWTTNPLILIYEKFINMEASSEHSSRTKISHVLVVSCKFVAVSLELFTRNYILAGLAAIKYIYQQ